ncbi:MAG: hypothetical protein AAGI01_01255 [Myxococcota bacterium]
MSAPHAYQAGALALGALGIASVAASLLPARTLSQPTKRTALPPTLSHASMSLRDPRGVQTLCPRVGSASFSCGKTDWLTYGTRTLSVHGRDATCTWFHPTKRHTSIVRYPWVTRQALEQDEVAFALSDRAASARKAPIHARVVFGAHAVERELAPQRGWQRVALPNETASGPLTIEVSTRDSGMAHLCYRLR